MTEEMLYVGAWIIGLIYIIVIALRWSFQKVKEPVGIISVIVRLITIIVFFVYIIYLDQKSRTDSSLSQSFGFIVIVDIIAFWVVGLVIEKLAIFIYYKIQNSRK